MKIRQNKKWKAKMLTLTEDELLELANVVEDLRNDKGLIAVKLDDIDLAIEISTRRE